MIVSARHKLIQTLREQAERAAEASVHHASLSQHYLNVSQRLSALADQSDEVDVAELERQLVTQSEQADVSPQLQQTLILNQSLRSISRDSFSASLQARSAPAAEQQLRDRQTTRAQEAVAQPPGNLTKQGNVDESTDSPTPVPQLEIRSSQGQPSSGGLELKQHASSVFTSLSLMSAVLILLSLWKWQVDIAVPAPLIECSFSSATRPLAEETAEHESLSEFVTDAEPVPDVPEIPQQLTEPVSVEPVPEPTLVQVDSAPSMSEGSSVVPTAAVGPKVPAGGNSRNPALRQLLLQEYGGSPESEEAVRFGLKWLASVQHPAGYWDFPIVGPAGGGGTVNNPIGGTAYALLPFLSAGHTHRDGEYQRQIASALAWLTKIGIPTPAGYDLRGMINKQSKDKEPNEAYYVHGAATLALCEAYGMTKDPHLKPAAEGAIRFIVNSQDPRGGGWRYVPQEAGSTSVTAIQVMALVAAQKAGLAVPESVFAGVRHYLDSVQIDGTGRYGYERQKKRYTAAVTSMALLCRMYLGWGRTDGDLRAGVELLDRAGPYDNLYSLYFSTQVMKHWGGESWGRWNTRMRDDLIAAQEKTGPGKGSWRPRTGAIHAKQGGRLLTTVLATLTLEVYYRYKPMLPPEKPSPQASRVKVHSALVHESQDP